MQSFQFVSAQSFSEVADLLGSDSMVLAGGTDLIPLMRDRIVLPRLIVDVNRVQGAGEVVVHQDGAAELGAVVRLTDVSNHPGVRRHYPALAQACAEVGTHQIRNVATLGGNLCQRPRCWYYRSGVSCLKSGGESCPAREGLNEYLAILGGGPCWAPHPSDPAVALVALGAEVTVRGRNGDTRIIPVGDLFVLPASRVDRETCLEPYEVIEQIKLRSELAGTGQAFYKVMQRQAWDFALVSIAVVWPKRGRQPRVVLGGVAPTPWAINPAAIPTAPRRNARAHTIDGWARQVAEQALKDARPLSQNGYKVDLAKNVMRKVLVETFRLA